MHTLGAQPIEIKGTASKQIYLPKYTYLSFVFSHPGILFCIVTVFKATHSKLVQDNLLFISAIWYTEVSISI